ncbi:hypothetical protein CcCBS67573_g10295 [Chytriomyces confervae]|uniref:Uncharacterized protein n=1 Tax=Chytriomyces confervae TaxID=246404 RepID=A0A507D694_9FUNG|nr:hypothetical protein CcCBS67573_g10295 [Chytriomyces confervae]
MSRQELLNARAQLLDEEAALLMALVENVSRRRAIEKKLCAGDECDVQVGSLDIALVPAPVSNTTIIELVSDDDHLKGDSREPVSQMESQLTLFGDDIVSDKNDLMVITTADLVNEETIQEVEPQPSQFLYCLYTDPQAIAAEAPWWWAQECATDASDNPYELTESEVSSTDIKTIRGLEEPPCAIVTKADGDILCSEILATDEQFEYSLYTDAAVIAAEVSWSNTLEALAHGSWCQKELVVDQQPEGHASLQPRQGSKESSSTSGSSARTKRKKIYRPPAKGVSRRLTQEEINQISGVLNVAYVLTIIHADGTVLNENATTTLQLIAGNAVNPVGAKSGTSEKYLLQSNLSRISSELHETVNGLFSHTLSAEVREYLIAKLDQKWQFLNDVGLPMDGSISLAADSLSWTVTCTGRCRSPKSHTLFLAPSKSPSKNMARFGPTILAPYGSAWLYQ